MSVEQAFSNGSNGEKDAYITCIGPAELSKLSRTSIFVSRLRVCDVEAPAEASGCTFEFNDLSSCVEELQQIEL
eukprot:701670-Amphidinium_carterae.1